MNQICCQMRPNSSQGHCVKASRQSKSLRHRAVAALSLHTGTAAIRVGCRTVASPLLPFLILVDLVEIRSNVTVNAQITVAASHVNYCINSDTCFNVFFLKYSNEYVVCKKCILFNAWFKIKYAQLPGCSVHLKHWRMNFSNIINYNVDC